jgi:SAM-dependent methyltransferase
MGTPDPRGAFTDIDRAADPAGFVRVLDALTALDFVRAYKRRTFELLGLEPRASVLDLGCGTGEDVQELARLVGPGGRVVGVDRSETVIAQASEWRQRACWSSSRWPTPTTCRFPTRRSMPVAPTGSSTTWNTRAMRSANFCV